MDGVKIHDNTPQASGGEVVTTRGENVGFRWFLGALGESYDRVHNTESEERLHYIYQWATKHSEDRRPEGLASYVQDMKSKMGFNTFGESWLSKMYRYAKLKDNAEGVFSGEGSNDLQRQTDNGGVDAGEVQGAVDSED